MSRWGGACDALYDWHDEGGTDAGGVLELIQRIDPFFVGELKAENERLKVCGNCKHVEFEYAWLECWHPDNCGVDPEYPTEAPHSLKDVGQASTCDKWTALP